MQISKTVDSFLNNFNGGNRTNRFVTSFLAGSVGPATEIDAGTNGGLNSDAKGRLQALSVANGSNRGLPIHFRATKIPDLTIGTIPVNYRGKTVLFPGDRVISNWEIIILDDHSDTPGNESSFNEHLHRAFMDWSNSIVPTDSRYGVQDFYGATRWSLSGGNVWTINQLDTWPVTGESSRSPGSNIVRTFKMYNCWPKEVGPIQLDMASDNSINSFRVVMAYTHMDGFDTGNGSGSWDGTSTAGQG